MESLPTRESDLSPSRQPVPGLSRATPTKKRIQILSPIVAERIAAGEVIERPSSVVKELVENSLDAGATEIQVLLEDGGKSLIEVLDNGHGMEPDELLLCVRRHATSKLSSLEDLEKLHTLGFRGEALPSVSAVAELSLLSRTAESDSASELILHSIAAETKATPQPVTFGHFLNSPHGTRIQVRGLFSQIPARLKFLKSQSAEVAQVREWMERLALAHPHAGFRLISDQRPILTLKAQEETARVRSLLSDGDDYPVITGSNDLGFRERDSGALHIRGHWLQGLSSPNSRRVIQVVNGRAVKDKLLQQAILSPFRQMLLPGQYPAFALFVEIDPAVIDVNVHPTKTEMRFLDSRKIFHAIDSMIQSMVNKHGAPAIAAPTWRASEPGGFFAERPPVSPAGGWTAAPSMAMPTTQPLLSQFQQAETSTFSTQGQPALQPGAESSATPSLNHPTGFPDLQPGQWVGIFFNTYLTYDLGQELVMIDQHAADERIRYERLRKRVLSGGQIALTTQALLIPEAVRFSEEARPRIQDRLGWLELLGFEAEIFGEDTLLFRSVPSEWGVDELRPRLKNLVTRLADLELPEAPSPANLPKLLLDESLFEALASEACHSAVRAGDRLEKEEAFQLVDDLFRCEHPWNCPHGRPTVARIPRARLEEWFQRRV